MSLQIKVCSPPQPRVSGSRTRLIQSASAYAARREVVGLNELSNFSPQGIRVWRLPEEGETKKERKGRHTTVLRQPLEMGFRREFRPEPAGCCMHSVQTMCRSG
uniref:Uncharacterized protein n=1 Tax=Hemiselmis andersenii TaxID=464988 RepID=A0A7S1DJG5_HEMAN|mmetsp:Transcript_40036/g.93736  ORF Transcript_40036/g.93736 Transcript_40036/m.93736 type:complete len:104 (+) Transcript_40036:117-428(+)